MGEVNVVYDITVQMDRLLQKQSDLERSELIKDLNELMEKREILIQQLSGPYTDEDKETGNRLLNLNKKVSIGMNILFNDVKQDLKQLRQQKESNKSYINPYGNMKTTDGLYLDSKQ